MSSSSGIHRPNSDIPSPMEMTMSNKSVLKLGKGYAPVPTTDIEMDAASPGNEKSESDSDWGWPEDAESDDEISRWMESLKAESEQEFGLVMRWAKKSLRMSKFMTFVLCLITSHSLAGLNPVINKMLQTGVDRVPPFTYGTIVHGLAIVLYSPRMAWKVRRMRREDPNLLSTVLNRRMLGYLFVAAIRTWVTYVFVLSVALRGFLSYVASSFTDAAFISLVDMMTPLVVTFLGYIFFRESSMMTWKFVLIIVCSVAGSLLVVVGGKSEGWHIGQMLSWSDFFGIVLSTASMLSLAIRSVVTYYITSHAAGSRDQVVKDITTDPEVIFFATKTVQLGAFMPFMILLEDVSFLWRLSAGKWVLLLLSCVLVHLIAVVLRITGSKNLSVTAEGALLPVKFISSVVLGALLLQEFVTVVETVGIAVICLCTFAFVYLRRISERTSQAGAERGGAVLLLPVSGDEYAHDKDYDSRLGFKEDTLPLSAPIKEETVDIRSDKDRKSNTSEQQIQPPTSRA